MKPAISIITPVYKAEKYMRRCIDSLLAQTFTDFELILIDDGSPDNSGAICEEYARKDPRVKVIHKENGGVSSARQCGIDNATGEYTIHADPDDWADATMLEELYEKATKENADIVICDYLSYKKGKNRHITQAPQSLEAKELLRQYLRLELHGALWNKLIKRELYTRYSIKFPKEITRWEDMFVLCSILTHNVRTTYLPKAFYHYDLSINPNSIVRKNGHKSVQAQILFVKHFQEILPQGEFDEELYRIKAATKELAYNSKALKPEEVLELYSEINEKYINSANPEDIRQLCFARFLSGKYSYNKAKRTRRILNLLQRIKRIF